MVTAEQAARNAAVDAAWKAFKDNPGWSTYKAWVRSGYVNYADSIEAQDLGVGSDVRLLADAAVDQTQEAALAALKSTMDFTINVVGPELLGVIEGAGVAIVKGVDRAFEYIGNRFVGSDRSPNVIAGFTVAILTVLSGVYLYQSVKNSNDAF
tara:strand:+ start:1470 stop:1928 length:459 start_codon:yes stop_codon:yes gene_type:complete